MSNLAERLDGANVGDESNGTGGGFRLSLDVSDPEVVRFLDRYAAGPERERYALIALRIGVLALEQASGQIDAAAVREAGLRLLVDVQNVLESRTQDMTGQVNAALKTYFDPSTGLLQQRIRSLVDRDGEIDRLLRAHLGPEDSVMARTLAQHLGNDSPVFRMLSPTQADGLKAQLEKVIEEALRQQREKVLGEFSLDNQQSALSRLVSQITTLQGDLKTNLGSQIGDLVKEFSTDSEGSALNRLTKALQRTTEEIGNHLTLDREDSALARLKREMSGLIENLTKGNTDFQSEVRATLASLQARREEAFRSTAHGAPFEEQVGALLSGEAQKLGDIYEATGNSTGQIKNCKVGDHVITLGGDSAAPGARVVFEAKENKAYGVPAALEELERARKNRGAQVGVFVYSKASAPADLYAFGRYGNDLLVVWDAEDPSTDVYLKASYSVARALTVREAGTAAGVEQIERAVRAIEKQAGYLDEIRVWASTVEKNGQKIGDRVAKMKDELAAQVAKLDEHVHALKSAGAEG